MKTELVFTPAAALSSELLAVFAVDNNTSKDKEAKPEIALLTSEEAVKKAAAFVLSSGEFKAEANEILLLHAPEGLKAARLLVVGLGKAGKATPHDLRKAAGTAVRFAKPRGIRSLAIAAPTASFDAELSLRAITEGAIVADFDSDTYRTDRKDLGVQSFTLAAPSEADDPAAKAAD